MSEYTATIEGTISWNLIFDYDNTENSGTIRDKLKVTTSESVQYEFFESSFNRTIRSELQRKHTGQAGASYKALMAKVQYATADVSSEIIETLETTTKTSFKANVSKTRTYERDILVGPRSKLSLYQQRFTAPGMSVIGSAVSTKPPPPQKVLVEYTVRPIQFVSGIRVHYGGQPSEAPPVRVTEVSHQSDDINYQYGGRYVWLVPTYTYKASEAATGFDLFIQGTAHAGWADLANGAGGSFRYIRAVNNPNNPRKVTSVALLRSDGGVGRFPAPYVGHTGDINANRGKTFLYFMWSVETAY